MPNRHFFVAATVALVLAAACAVPSASRAQAAAGPGGETRYEVKRAKVKPPAQPSLRFLRANRDFLRAQLDRLRLQAIRLHGGDAESIDPRWLMLRDMAAAVAAARDTVAVEDSVTAWRGLLTSVTGLADLETQLDRMQGLLNDQGVRLAALESDYLDRQETALVLLLSGGRAGRLPAGVVVGDGDDRLQVPLTDGQRDALAAGGVVQVMHRLVEPRDHQLDLVFTGAAGDTLEAAVVPVTAERDRLTFVELDLDGLAAGAVDTAPAATVWRR